MAAALRHALENKALKPWLKLCQPTMAWLAIAGIAVVFAPILPGLIWALMPGLSPSIWHALWINGEWPQALLATLISAGLSSLAALLLAGTIALRVYPEISWSRLQHRLPLLLSVPHAAFAVGLFFLIAPSGWLARLIAQFAGWITPPEWVSVQDPFALSLALALAIKESWFLLWVLGAVLGEQEVARQMVSARTLGYNRLQAWRLILIPQLLPRLGWPMAAVFAYGLSVVDMAIILGPSNPPTLAVLVWHWLSDAAPLTQALGSAAAIAMFFILLLIVAISRILWRLSCKVAWLPSGKRAAFNPSRPSKATPSWTWRLLALTGYLVLATLLLWSVAGSWFFPALWPGSLSLESWLQANFTPFANSLWLGMVACLIALPIALLWLEWGPKRFNAILYAPLIIPALPLVVGQYAALLHSGLDGTACGLAWSHLLWVLPYMLLTLIGPYRAFDSRLLSTAQALGRTRLQACLYIKWPMLLRPLLAAFAIGFSVSIAQYLPTLFAGAGRFATVTTEAVALSASGNRRVLAVQAVLQVVLPLAAFALTVWLGHWAGKYRRGLR